MLKLITNKTNLPVIASGGFGKLNDIKEALIDSKVDAIAIADAIHYNKFNIRDIRSEALNLNLKLENLTNEKISVLNYGCGNLLNKYQ